MLDDNLIKASSLAQKVNASGTELTTVSRLYQAHADSIDEPFLKRIADGFDYEGFSNCEVVEVEMGDGTRHKAVTASSSSNEGRHFMIFTGKEIEVYFEDPGQDRGAGLVIHMLLVLFQDEIVRPVTRA